MFISLSLYRYFSLSLFIYLCLCLTPSLYLVVWFFGYIFMLFRLPVERLLLLCFPRRIPRVFHLPMRRRRVVPKIVYCVCSAFFSFFFWALPSQSPVNRITELGLQAHKHACKFQGLSTSLSICLSACLCLIYCFQAIFISMYFSRKRIALSVRLCPCFVCMFQA